MANFFTERVEIGKMLYTLKYNRRIALVFDGILPSYFIFDWMLEEIRLGVLLSNVCYVKKQFRIVLSLKRRMTQQLCFIVDCFLYIPNRVYSPRVFCFGNLFKPKEEALSLEFHRLWADLEKKKILLNPMQMWPFK